MAYRNDKSGSGKSEAGDLGGIGELASNVFEIGVERAGESSSGRFKAKSFRNGLRRSELGGGGPSRDGQLGGLHKRSRRLN